MIIGYARVSTIEQNNELQEDALKAAGCEKIFSDKISGSIKERPGLERLRDTLRAGDTVVIWRLDRLGRSLKDLIEWISYFETNGISLKSLQESLDTSTASGKLIFHIFASLSEFERNLIKERTVAGLVAARARGRVGGRPESLEQDQIDIAVKLYKNKEMSIDQICKFAKITKPTLYRYVRKASCE